MKVILNLKSLTLLKQCQILRGKFLGIGFMWQGKEKVCRKENTVIILERNYLSADSIRDSRTILPGLISELALPLQYTYFVVLILQECMVVLGQSVSALIVQAMSLRI